ncbi:MAG: hypothetical protein JHC26_12655 [Thermofilum sp.]|jgi:hypothetical protein|uniref:hypothetical protein n=1 Tax=Thermofilum sp. TaxID=1961369 RepID=UPI002583D8DF|nr:hypothetical protein [Thermofilum sp.]MCI4409936.1 hypothetical protein [Thermofilum sp.]
MPVFGGVARVNIGGTVYTFDKLYATLSFDSPLTFSSVMCTYYNGWKCGETIIPRGTYGKQGYYFAQIPLIDTRLNYSLTLVSSSIITVIANHNANYDPVAVKVPISSGYIYVFIWEKLTNKEAIDVYCQDVNGNYTGYTYIQGPTVFFAYHDPISGADNGGWGNCDYVTASAVTQHDFTHSPSILRISSTSYITTIPVALFAGGRGILPGTRKQMITSMLDLSAVRL